MKIALLGSRGQLGAELLAAFRARGHEVRPFAGRAELDATRPEAVRSALAASRPDAVVSTAAFHVVDECETRGEEAFRVNGLAQKGLAAAAAEAGAAFVFFSSDYVFGGDEKRRTPYREEDAPAPLSVYGASKLAGEALALAYNPRTFVFRVCGLYGVHPPAAKPENFPAAMLRFAREGKPIRVVDDQRCAPTYAVDAAAGVVNTLERGAVPGLYHLTNAGDCTWFEFAREIFRLAGLSPDLSPCATAECPRPARRPSYSVLDGGRLRAAGVSPLRPWREALRVWLDRFRKAEGGTGRAGPTG